MTSLTAFSGNRERGSVVTALISVIVALLIIAAVVAALYRYDTQPAASAGQIVSLEVFPVQNTSDTGVIAGGVSGQSEQFNEVIVLANVALKNTAKVPIDLFDLDSYLYFSDADTYENGAASREDFQRVFDAYPFLKPKEAQPLLRNTVLAPGQQITGQLVFHYPLTLQQWRSRTKFHIVINWKHQDNLILKLKGNATSSGWQH